jgi:hypothetical protein
LGLRIEPRSSQANLGICFTTELYPQPINFLTEAKKEGSEGGREEITVNNYLKITIAFNFSELYSRHLCVCPNRRMGRQ